MQGARLGAPGALQKKLHPRLPVTLYCPGPSSSRRSYGMVDEAHCMLAEKISALGNESGKSQGHACITKGLLVGGGPPVPWAEDEDRPQIGCLGNHCE